MSYIEGTVRTNISNTIDTKTKLDNETIAMLSSIAKALNKISDCLESIQDEIHAMSQPKVKGTRNLPSNESAKRRTSKKKDDDTGTTKEGWLKAIEETHNIIQTTEINRRKPWLQAYKIANRSDDDIVKKYDEPYIMDLDTPF